MLSRLIIRGVAVIGIAAVAAAISAGMAIAAGGASKSTPTGLSTAESAFIQRLATGILQTNGTVTAQGQRVLDAARGDAQAIASIEQARAQGQTLWLLVVNVKNGPIVAGTSNAPARATHAMRVRPHAARRRATTATVFFSCGLGGKANIVFHTGATANTHVNWTIWNGVGYVTTSQQSAVCSVVNQPCYFAASDTPAPTHTVTKAQATAAASLVVIDFYACG